MWALKGHAVGRRERVPLSRAVCPGTGDISWLQIARLEALKWPLLETGPGIPNLEGVKPN